MKPALILKGAKSSSAFAHRNDRNIHSWRIVHWLVFALSALLVTPLLRADTITVVPTVTRDGSLFLYDYTITDNLPITDDAFLIDIAVPAFPGSITNLTAPAGFTAAFDSGLGLVSFLEDSNSFGSTPISGFSFDSAGAPVASTFEATIFSSDSGSIITLDGTTVAPAGTAASPVPEPNTLLLTLSCVPLFLLIRHRFKQDKRIRA